MDYGDANPANQLSGDGPTLRSFSGAGGIGGLLLAEIALPADLAAAPAGPGLHSFSGVGWVGADANGNTILWSSTGTTTYPADTVLASYAYDPFGNPLAEGPTLHSFSGAGLPYTFSTKPHDPLTHHTYYGYRWYTTDTGRWLSRDPINEADEANLLVFIGNSSITSIDYFGLFRYLTGSDPNPQEPNGKWPPENYIWKGWTSKVIAALKNDRIEGQLIGDGSIPLSVRNWVVSFRRTR
jgi:RHS repeat-associated protein